MRQLLWICGGWLLTGLWSCGQPSAASEDKGGESIPVEYARGLLLESLENYTHVIVRHPQDTDQVLAEYYLYRTDSVPVSIQDKQGLIHVPVEKIVCLSTTQVGMLEVLDATDRIIGISGTQWVYNEQVSTLIEQGQIREIGQESGLNKELLIQMQPDVILGYASGIAGYDEVDGLSQLGLPVVLIQEFTELHPLGMAEWVKLVALLLDEPAAGDAYFQQVANRYISLTVKAGMLSSLPTVFTGLPYRGEWTVSGGQSFAAQYIRDAGGNYIWADNALTGNFPVSLEEVLLKAADATIWVNPGGASGIQDIIREDERLKHLSAVQTGRVANNNKRLNQAGGNDYWESAVVHPDDVLYDLMQIFHPQHFGDTAMIYYQWLP